MSKKKPTRVGLSWGDPHGIGSECILKAFADERLFEDLLPVVYGHAETLRQQAGQFDVHIDIRQLALPELPSTDDAQRKAMLAQWMRNVWQEKDRLIGELRSA